MKQGVKMFQNFVNCVILSSDRLNEARTLNNIINPRVVQRKESSKLCPQEINVEDFHLFRK